MIVRGGIFRNYSAIYFVILFILSISATASGSSINYLCFFPPRSDAVSEQCESILRDFVSREWNLAEGRAGGDTSGIVAVAGHVDGAEATGGASLIGAQRARAVGEWLIQAGIPRSAVVTRNYDAQLPRVPPRSSDLAEPQNRYVQVYIRVPETPMTPQMPSLNRYP